MKDIDWMIPETVSFEVVFKLRINILNIRY